MTELSSIDIQGHRGARGLYPENTLSAFIEAVKLGVNTIELDVVISKDLKVVVSHEAWMNSTFCSLPNGEPILKSDELNHNLYMMNYDKIKQFDCGKKLNPEFPFQKTLPQYKPLLSEVILTIENYTEENHLQNVKYNIELKSEINGIGIYNPSPDIFVDLVYTELKKYNIVNRSILQSFDVAILQEIRKKDKSVIISLLVENTDDLKTNLNLLGFIPNIYGPEFILITPQLIKELKFHNIKLIPWTVNEINDMIRLINLGVHGIITDYPDRLIHLLKNIKQ